MNRKIKVTLLGEQNTGKTSIIIRLMREIFKRTDATIGATYASYKNDDIIYDLWDTAGSERFMALTPMYYRGSDIIVLVYDLSNLSSMDKVKFFLNRIREELKKEYAIILVGNKLDLIDNKDNIRNPLKDEHNIDFVCISAKTGENFADFKEILFKHGKYFFNNKQLVHTDLDKIELIKSDNDKKCEC